MELAGIFGWDIDFALDIREGDQFAVLYEGLYLDGERIGTGNILAAEFTNQGKLYRAVRYTDARGHTDYYAPDGHSMRKTFLRTPVSFTRISSRFNSGRKHPILNRIRAHKGVDYAAATGTPVKATGNGKIVLRGKKGGYGNTVVIQHGSSYSTLYAHLNNFARGKTVGSRVQQGEIIGYVGSTGLATGPHLHYEFRVNGVHRNPLTVKLPDAAPLPKKFREDFKLATENLIAQLELAKTQTVALQDN
jgi:murein DD-endopeptidase MepM/ murein hydrolase activator NlpD